MEPVFFDVDFKTRQDCQKLYKNYKLGKYIGKWAYGKVHELCRDGECKYVLKVTEYDPTTYQMSGQEFKSLNSYYNRWINEIDMHKQMEICQKSFFYKFTPYLYDAWFCIDKN